MKEFNTVVDSPKIAVSCSSFEEWEKALEILGNPKKLNESDYRSYEGRTSSFTIKDDCGNMIGCYGYKARYEEHGYAVIQASVFINANTKPKDGVINSYSIF